MTTPTAMDDFKATLSQEVPLRTGVVPLDTNISHLFYRNAADGSSGFIDFSTAVIDTQIEQLVRACQPATFGIQQKDVLDESYRKAWKMDAANFATNFNPINTGIIRTIHELLLKDPESSIRVELYKLNVYGPGSFFKAHVDTPRSAKMFGSLVVVLPTRHEGGTLILRHHGREWSFSSGDIVSPQNPPHAAFIAFFGDVEHEVSVVKSGYRVTLTYNLYFGDDKPTIAPTLSIDDTEVKIKRSLMTLLNDKNFLPDGGLLGFGLSYQYPVNRGTKLHLLGKSLKGTDAALKRACDSLSLAVSVKALYKSDQYQEGVACLLNQVVDLDTEMEIEGDIVLFLKQYSSSALLVYDMSDASVIEHYRRRFDDAVPILWLRELTERNQIEVPYVRYGNEATLGYLYGEICLVVEVEDSENREALV